MYYLRLMRNAKWRRAPASDSQRKFVETRWFKKVNADNGDDSTDKKALDVASLTKGEAANIITRIKHGAVVCGSR